LYKYSIGLTFLKRFQPGDVDVILLPEMAFTGKFCLSLWMLEDAMNGFSVSWARQQGKAVFNI